MKKTKYFIEVGMIDNCMVKPIEISKKEYEAQLAFNQRTVRKTTDDECPVEENYTQNEYDTFTEFEHRFTCGCCTVWLTKKVCKKGYAFT